MFQRCCFQFQMHTYIQVYAVTRAIQKVISGELLTKQAMRKKNIILYKRYAHT
jgi:hypothetical protein